MIDPEIVDKVTIEYDTLGDPAHPTLLLIAGNGAQLNFWEVEFCNMLVESGLFVIRFDNRDAGLSTKFDSAEVPDIMQTYQALAEGKPVSSAYTLNDMADDAVALLDGLKIKKAHICGASMGGMIAQLVACRHPHRVLSLTSIMSGTGNPELPPGKPEAIAMLVAPPPDNRNDYIEHQVEIWRKIWSPGFPFEEERARKYVQESFDRCFCPSGMARQNVALLLDGDRRSRLATISAPTLVIHGSEDPLIPLEAGKDTARSIPGATLIVINGMGHDMPRGAWLQIVDAISDVVREIHGV